MISTVKVPVLREVVVDARHAEIAGLRCRDSANVAAIVHTVAAAAVVWYRKIGVPERRNDRVKAQPSGITTGRCPASRPGARNDGTCRYRPLIASINRDRKSTRLNSSH